MLELLACPRCRAALTPEAGRLRCPCATYPVVAGIPILTGWARGGSFTLGEVLARHRPAARGLRDKILRRIAPGSGRLGRAAADPGATFTGLLETFGRENDLDYFRCRPGSPNHLLSCAALAPVTRGPVLDLACGAGHRLRELSRRLPARELAGLDLNFALLYLARRFVAPGCFFVCADAAPPLPFRDAAFEAAACADAFRYFPDPAATARDLLRVTRGALVLSVLEDPARLLEALASRAPRTCADRRLLDEFLRTRRLDLGGPEARPGESCTLLAGVEPRVYDASEILASGAALNPVYEVLEEGDRLQLRRRPLPEPLAGAYRDCGDLLPEALTITRAQLAARDPDLVRRFVLVDAPGLGMPGSH